MSHRHVMAPLAVFLLVPAAQAEQDHLQAIQVTDADKIEPEGTYTIQTDSGPVMCTLKKAKLALLQAEKNGGDDVRGGEAGRFVCYQAKCEDPDAAEAAFNDQFGTHSLTTKKTKLVCAPANEVICGDNELEEGEQCDGTDDATCPGACESDCTCDLSTPTCCETVSGCGGMTLGACTAAGGTPVGDSICDIGGDCASDDTITTYGCCELADATCSMPANPMGCTAAGGVYFNDSYCAPDGQCVSPKRVFRTGASTGSIGVAGIQNLCTTAAANAGLPGSYKAWISADGLSPSDRLTHATVPYIRTDGVKVADDWDDLTDNTLDAPISANEFGSSSLAGPVWTGATATGGSFYNCLNWTTGSSAEFGVRGSSTAVDSTWSQLLGQAGCSNQFSFYCFQQ